MATPKKPNKDKKAAPAKPAAKPAAKDGGKAAEKSVAKTVPSKSAKPAPAASNVKKAAVPAKAAAPAKAAPVAKDSGKEKEIVSKAASSSASGSASRKDKERAPAPKVQVVEEPPAPKARPKLSKEDQEWQQSIRDALSQRRSELLSMVQANRAQMAGKAGDSADVSDRASEGFEDELAAGLIAIEAAQLEDIDDAINRIDSGDYGYCATCDKPIPRKRLDFLPFAKRCVTCEGSHERTRQVQTSYEEADDND